MHPGCMILFENEDEQWCEKCYADTDKAFKDLDMSIVGRDRVGEQIAPEDLIARLRAPIKQPEERKIS